MGCLVHDIPHYWFEMRTDYLKIKDSELGAIS